MLDLLCVIFFVLGIIYLFSGEIGAAIISALILVLIYYAMVYKKEKNERMRKDFEGISKDKLANEDEPVDSRHII